MVGLLFCAINIDHFALLPGGQHGVGGGVDAALGLSKGGDALVAALFKQVMIGMGLRGLRSAARGGEQAAQFGPMAGDLFVEAIERVKHLLARQQRARVLFQGLVLLALAQRTDRFQRETKCFHGRLAAAALAGGGTAMV